MTSLRDPLSRPKTLFMKDNKHWIDKKMPKEKRKYTSKFDEEDANIDTSVSLL